MEPYVYQPYPAWRYHPDGRSRVIQNAQEEEENWFDSPAKAKSQDVKPPEATPAPEPVAVDPAPDAEPEVEAVEVPSGFTKDGLFRMKRDEMYELAVEKGLDVAEDAKRPQLMKVLLATLGD